MSKYINFHEKFQSMKEGGGKGGGGSSINSQVAQAAEEAKFRPFTLTTGSGSAYGNANNEFGASANQQFADLQGQSLAGANQLTPQLLQALGRQPDQFAFNSNVDQLSKDYFANQQAALDPVFAQQRAELGSDLFGSGRLGLRLASEGVGAGEGGFVQPDAFGLARAQSQTTQDAYNQSRQMAMQEAQNRYGLESGVFGLNQGTQQQYTQNLLGGTQGLFGMGTGVASLENELLKLGLSAEQARAMSAANAGQMLASGKEEKKDGKGFLGSVVGAAGQIGASAVGSDMRLKNNIVLVETDDAGISWYTWEWNDIAKELGLDSSTPYGVMAQEVMHIVPKAVTMGDDGYYRVDYNKVAGGTK